MKGRCQLGLSCQTVHACPKSAGPGRLPRSLPHSSHSYRVWPQTTQLTDLAEDYLTFNCAAQDHFSATLVRGTGCG